LSRFAKSAAHRRAAEGPYYWGAAREEASDFLPGEKFGGECRAGGVIEAAVKNLMEVSGVHYISQVLVDFLTLSRDAAYNT